MWNLLWHYSCQQGSKLYVTDSFFNTRKCRTSDCSIQSVQQSEPFIFYRHLWKSEDALLQAVNVLYTGPYGKPWNVLSILYLDVEVQVCVHVYWKKGRHCDVAKLLSHTVPFHTVRLTCLFCSVQFVCLAVTFPIRTWTQINIVVLERGKKVQVLGGQYDNIQAWRCLLSF